MSNVTLNRPSSSTPQPGAGAVEDQITQGTAQAEAKKDKTPQGKVAEKSSAEAKQAGAKQAATEELDPKQLKSGQQLFALDAIAKTPEQALAAIAMLGGSEPVVTDTAAPREVATAKVLFEALAEKIDPNNVPDAESIAKPFALAGASDVVALASAPALHTPESIALTGAIRFINGGGKLEQASPRVLERIELFKAYQKVMDAAEGKGEATAASLRLRMADLPNAFKKAVEQAAPQIATAYKQWFGTKSELEKKLDQRKLSDEAIIHGELPVIPGPIVQQMEAAVKVMHSGAREALKDLQAGKEKLKIKLRPEILKILGGKAQAEKTPEFKGADYDVPKPLHFGSGLSGGLMAMLVNGDIETLLSIVMMECEKTESDMLRDLMKEMALKNEQKKALREAKTKMKEDSARLDAQMRNEYNELRATGDIHPTITYDDFKAWREIQWGNVEVNVEGGVSYGGAALSPLPPLPPHFKTGNVAPAAGGANVNPASAEAYGIPPALQETLLKMYNALPADRKPPDFVSYLSGTLGLVNPQSKQDITDNLGKVKAALEGAKTGGAGATTGVHDANACKPGGALYNAVNELMQLQILVDLDCVLTKQLADAQAALQKELAKALPETSPPFVDQYQTMLMELKDAATIGFQKMEKNASSFWDEGPGGPGGPGKNPSKWHSYESSWNDATLESVLVAVLTGGAAEVIAGAASSGAGAGSDFVDGEWDESFKPGMGWVSKAEAEEDEVTVADGGTPDGYSEPKKVEWTSEGMLGYGYYKSYNDVDESSKFFVAYPTGNDWVKGFEAMLSKTGQKLSGTGEEWSGMAATAIETINSVLDGSNMVLAGAPAAGQSGMPTNDDLSAMAAKVQTHIDKLKNPKSDFSKWVYEKNFDGQKTRDEEKKKQAEYAKQQKQYKDDNAGALRMDQHGTIAQFDAAIQGVEDKLASLSEMSEMDSLRLQTLMDRRAKLIETLSNMLKKISQTDSTITGNLK